MASGSSPAATWPMAVSATSTRCSRPIGTWTQRYSGGVTAQPSRSTPFSVPFRPLRALTLLPGVAADEGADVLGDRHHAATGREALGDGGLELGALLGRGVLAGRARARVGDDVGRVGAAELVRGSGASGRRRSGRAGSPNPFSAPNTSTVLVERGLTEHRCLHLVELLHVASTVGGGHDDAVGRDDPGQLRRRRVRDPAGGTACGWRRRGRTSRPSNGSDCTSAGRPSTEANRSPGRRSPDRLVDHARRQVAQRERDARWHRPTTRPTATPRRSRRRAPDAPSCSSMRARTHSNHGTSAVP